MSFNKVLLLGRCEADPEMRHTPAGSAVCTFGVYTREHWTDKSGKREERSELHRVVTWGRLAENCKRRLARDSPVLVEGKVRTREVEREGVKRRVTEVMAEQVQFLGEGAHGRVGDQDRGRS